MTLFGTYISFHWSLLIPFLFCIQDPIRVYMLAAIFVLITLHEFGHIAMCRLFGNDCKRITLCAMGGMAHMDRANKRPWEEFCVGIGGPLVNVLLIVVLDLLTPLVDPTFLKPLILVNVVMLLFNMIPAFPMDGGRVMRSVLWAMVGVRWANRICLTITLTLAGLGTIIGIQHGNYWFAAVAAFVAVVGALSFGESDEQETVPSEVEAGPRAGRPASEQNRELLRPDARALGHDSYIRREIQEGIPTEGHGGDGSQAQGAG